METYRLTRMQSLSIVLFLHLLITACSTTGPVVTQSFAGQLNKYRIDYIIPPVRSTDAHFIVNEKSFIASANTSLPDNQGVFLLENINIKQGDTVLDIGTGAGLHAIFAADNARQVIATDIDSTAIKDARNNIKTNHKENIVEVRQGDLFAVLKPEEKFDVIICGLPYPHFSAQETAWTLQERFFADVKTYLKPDGVIFLHSGWLQNLSKVAQMVSTNDLVIADYNFWHDIPQGTPPIVVTIKQPLK